MNAQQTASHNAARLRGCRTRKDRLRANGRWAGMTAAQRRCPRGRVFGQSTKKQVRPAGDDERDQRASEDNRKWRNRNRARLVPPAAADDDDDDHDFDDDDHDDHDDNDDDNDDDSSDDGDDQQGVDQGLPALGRLPDLDGGGGFMEGILPDVNPNQNQGGVHVVGAGNQGHARPPPRRSGRSPKPNDGRYHYH